MNKTEKKDLIILLIWPILASIISFKLRTNSFMSIILFLTIPGIYLSFRAKQHIKKTAIFSLIVAIPLMIIIDYIASITKQWAIPNSILPVRLFGIVTIEAVTWAVFLAYFIIMFYKHFLDKSTTKKLLHQKMRYAIIILLILSILFLIILFTKPSLMNIEYSYLIIGILLILIPIIVELFTHPHLVSNFFKAASYFFYLTLIYEITALKLGWWYFPLSKFIGWVEMLGVRFPLEEFVFWFMLTAMGCLTYYKTFGEDQK